MAFDNAGGRVSRGRVADQIVEDLRTQILTHELSAGEKLPAERDLATYYGVSGPTIREAIRVLTAIGLVDTRTGSGSVVTGQVDKLIAISIASVVQFEKMSPPDMFGVLGALYSHAAEVAAKNASDSEIEALRSAAEKTGKVQSVEQISTDLKRYFRTLAEISHNPLLITICRFITEVQLGLAAEHSAGDVSSWRRVAGGLHDKRMDIVDALQSRDAARASELVREYHQLIIDRVQRVRRGRGQESDLGSAESLSSWLETHVTLGSPPRGARSSS
jgi:DNA-binding FadR family transcriptional regulator